MSRFLTFFLPRSPDNSLNSTSRICRICHDDERTESLISPCRCAGTVGLVHQSCLEKWLSIANADKCELCGYSYVCTKKPLPFRKWMCGGECGDDQHTLIGDLICFLILTPLAVASAYLCFLGALHFHMDHTTSAAGLVGIASFLIVMYFIWMFMTIRYHCRAYQEWKGKHQDVQLLRVESTAENRDILP